MGDKVQYRVEAGKFLVDEGSLKISESVTSLQFKPSGKTDVVMTLQITFTPLAIGDTTITLDKDNKYGLFDFATPLFQSGCPALSAFTTNDDIISLDADTVKIKAAGKKVEHGVTFIGKEEHPNCH
jgi:hypothetical protein